MTTNLPHFWRPSSPSRARVVPLLALALAVLSTVAMPKTAGAATPARVFHIAPVAAGRADGSSWANAGSLSKLPAFVQAAEPGDEVWLLGGGRSYPATKPISIRHGGAPGVPVTVRGVAADGTSSATPLLVGSRTSPWVTGGNTGTDVIRLLAGADHLRFSNLAFANQGNGCFYLGGPVDDITIEQMRATNVKRFIENYTVTGQAPATVTNLVVRDVTVQGFSRGAVRLQYDTNNVLLEDVHGDSQRQEDGDFAIGVHLDGTVHDVTHRRVTMNNSHQDGVSYWNGDGFASEGDTYRLTYEDTHAAGHTDAGYDLKSDDTLLVGATAADSKRNFRFWGTGIVLRDGAGEAPYRRGGSGSQAQVHVLGTAGVTVEDSRFTDARTDTVVFHVEDSAALQVVDGAVTKAPSARLSAVEPEASLTFESGTASS